MKTLRLLFLPVLCLWLLTGCSKLSQPTLDTTSDKTLKKSSVTMSEALPPEKRREFDRSVIGLSTVVVVMAEPGARPKTMPEAMKPFHGMNADQIVAEYKKREAERKAKLGY